MSWYGQSSCSQKVKQSGTTPRAAEAPPGPGPQLPGRGPQSPHPGQTLHQPPRQLGLGPSELPRDHLKPSSAPNRHSLQTPSIFAQHGTPGHVSLTSAGRLALCGFDLYFGFLVSVFPKGSHWAWSSLLCTQPIQPQANHLLPREERGSYIRTLPLLCYSHLPLNTGQTPWS